MTAYHLAQANIARMRGALDDPVMAEFVEWLEPINALADVSPGFVWRLQTEQGDNTSIRVFADPLILLYMSVWESTDALEAYVYRTDHVRALQERKSWFEGPPGPTVVLWWIEAGTLPTTDDAKKRLELLQAKGPTRDAFTFSSRFDSPRGLVVTP